MTKRIIGLILAACLALTLAGCGDTAKTPAATEAPKQTEAPKPTEAPKATEAPKPAEAPKETEAPKSAEAPKETEAPKPTEAPKAAETPAQKARISKEEIAERLDKAETAAALQALIEDMEGAYGEDEVIEFGGDTLTLAQLREMQALYAAIEGLNTPQGGEPVTGDALNAVGEWTGVYGKFVGDDNGVTDEPFSLVLNDDGTGVHSRNDLELNVTWTLDGEEFAMTEHFFGMTIDYTGTLTGNVLRIFNGDPADDFTYEYVYGRGDLSGIEIPRAEVDTAGLGRFRGDWNGALGFRNCTGKYEYLNNSNVGAIARFAVQDDGSIDAFIGVNVEDTPFVDLTARYSDFFECLLLSGKWINVPFEDVWMDEADGTLRVTIPIEKEAGSLDMVMNFRRLDDDGWTDEDPGLSPENIEFCKGKTFGELAEIIGYDFWDYPSPDEG